MSRDLRFPYPLTDDARSPIPPGDRRIETHVRHAKTELTPGAPSYEDAMKLARRLGADGAAAGDERSCPTFVFLRRGSSLRSKDAEVATFRKPTHLVFGEWAWARIKTAVLWRNDDPTETVHVYWHAPDSPDGDPRGTLAVRVPPLSEQSTSTYPTHTFSAYWATAHANADGRDADRAQFALPPGAALATHVVTNEQDVVVKLPGDRGPVDAHVSCRRVTDCGGARIRQRCPRTCAPRGEL